MTQTDNTQADTLEICVERSASLPAISAKVASSLANDWSPWWVGTLGAHSRRACASLRRSWSGVGLLAFLIYGERAVADFAQLYGRAVPTPFVSDVLSEVALKK